MDDDDTNAANNGMQKQRRRQTTSFTRPCIEELVNVRLRSSWGRPVGPFHSRRLRNALHEMISQIDNKKDATDVDRFGLQRQWTQVQTQCLASPLEASTLDGRGRTCLHAVCVKKPPVAVISAIIRACGRHGESILERDKHGRTPLAIAISSNASLEVIALLLRNCPRAAAVSDHAGLLPLHLACSCYDGGKVTLARLLLEVYPEGAVRESNDGRTALHVAIKAVESLDLIHVIVSASPKSFIMEGCGLNPLFIALRRNCSPEIVKVLVQGYPEVAYSRDRCESLPLRRAVEARSSLETLELLAVSPRTVLDADRSMGKTALHSALDCGVPRESMVRLMVHVAPEIALLPSKSGQTPLLMVCHRFLQYRNRGSNPPLWNILTLLCRAAKYNRIQESDPILHAMVSLNLPWEITKLAMQLFPEQLRERDQDGYYPLLLALQSDLEKSKSDMVLSFLRLYEEAASIPTPNGRSVLSLSASSKFVAPVIFHELVTRRPESLYEVDPIYGMYPFQVAALPKAKGFPSDRSSQEEPPPQDQWLQLSAIFELLVAAPELIQAPMERIVCT